MPYQRSDYKKGMRLEGGVHPVEDPRRAGVAKGVFMTSSPRDGGPVYVHRPPPPEDRQHAELANQATDQAAKRLREIRYRHGVAVTEIARRLTLVRQQLDSHLIKAGKK